MYFPYSENHNGNAKTWFKNNFSYLQVSHIQEKYKYQRHNVRFTRTKYLMFRKDQSLKKIFQSITLLADVKSWKFKCWLSLPSQDA